MLVLVMVLMMVLHIKEQDYLEPLQKLLKIMME